VETRERFSEVTGMRIKKLQIETTESPSCTKKGRFDPSGGEIQDRGLKNNSKRI